MTDEYRVFNIRHTRDPKAIEADLNEAARAGFEWVQGVTAGDGAVLVLKRVAPDVSGTD